MRAKLKKVALTGKRKFEITDAEIPRIENDDDVLLKIDSVGVCGSDMHYYNEGGIGDQIIEFPFTIGHEGSAVVAEVGVNVTKVKKGDIVAIEPAVSCLHCEQCRSGREHTCRNLQFLGCPGQLDGCLSEYIVMPERNCYPVPGNMNVEDAALVEPISISYYASTFLDDIREVHSAAILGVGPIGMGVLLSLQNRGIKDVYVTDKLDYRLAMAKTAGAVWSGNPTKEDVVTSIHDYHSRSVDVVFECCGQQEALDQAIEILKPGGTLLIVGIPSEDRISFDISKLRRKEITVQNVRRQNHCVQPVIDLIASGKISPHFMITHRFPFEKTMEAFEMVNSYSDGVLKAMISF